MARDIAEIGRLVESRQILDRLARTLYFSAMDDRTKPPTWPLQDAKNRFSEVVRRARDEGPQTVTVHGRRAAVVLSAEAYDALAEPRAKKSFVDHLLSGPPWDEEFAGWVEDRQKDLPRDIDL
jgi:prevent-host-death family protein